MTPYIDVGRYARLAEPRGLSAGGDVGRHARDTVARGLSVVGREGGAS